MRATPIPADKQFKLIMECRASGLTDHEWCLQHDINPGTFYNWVKRLRQKGCSEIPDAIRKPVPHKQEIVKIELTSPGKNETFFSTIQKHHNSSQQSGVMSLSIAGTVLLIPNGTDPGLLEQTLHILKELSC